MSGAPITTTPSAYAEINMGPAVGSVMPRLDRDVRVAGPIATKLGGCRCRNFTPQSQREHRQPSRTARSGCDNGKRDEWIGQVETVMDEKGLPALLDCRR